MNIRAVLLDIAGVLHEGGVPLPGALEAVQKLRDAGIQLRFVTNTSRRTRSSTVAQLQGMGFAVEAEQVFTAPLAARSYLEHRDLRPLLVIHPDLAEDFQGMNCEDPNSVFVADAAEHFAYPLLDQAFRLLIEGAPFTEETTRLKESKSDLQKEKSSGKSTRSFRIPRQGAGQVILLGAKRLVMV